MDSSSHHHFNRAAVDHFTSFDLVLKESPRLKEYLKKFDRIGLVRILSGLLTCAECHANTIRLEALIHLAVSFAEGRKTPNRSDISKLVGSMLRGTGLLMMEDPLEDVFVSNVIDGTGNHRIFEGIWERNDYWLQSLLKVLCALPDNSDYRSMMRSIRALLKISEAIADRNDLQRNTEGGGEDKGQIYLPPWEELLAYSRNVVFTPLGLEELGINASDLKPFVWEFNKEKSALSSDMGNSHLERRPLLELGGSVVVLLPTAISAAIRRFVVETVESNKDLRIFEKFLHDSQMRELTELGLSRLKAKPVNQFELPELQSKPPFCLTISPFRFDSDKFGVFCFITPRMYSDHLLVTNDRDDTISFEEYLSEVISFVSSTQKFSSGMLVLAVGGLGAGIAILPIKLPSNWQFISYSAPNLLTLAGLQDLDLLTLWRLAKQQGLAEEQNVQFVNPNGDFNLYSAWREQEYELVPENIPVGDRSILICPQINSLLHLRRKVRCSLDVHAALRKSTNHWIEIERKNAYSPISESRGMPFYGAGSCFRKGEIAGVIETSNTWCWIACEDKPSSDQENSIMFQMWNCVGQWLSRVVQRLLTGVEINKNVYELRLLFPHIANWSREIDSLENIDHCELDWDQPVDDLVKIKITEAFLQTFAQSKNVAEREVVISLLQIVSNLAHIEISKISLDKIRDEIIPLGAARDFHVMGKNDASLYAHSGPRDVYFVRDEVLAEVYQKLGFAVAPEDRERKIEGRDDVRRIVRKSVDHLKDEITRKLRSVNLQDIVCRCLEILDSIHSDHHTWEISAAAMLSLSSDKNELKKEAIKQESKRAGTSIAARTLIETALFSCSSTDCGEIVSDSTLDELLAMAQAVVEIADYDIPIRANFPVGNATIAPSGKLSVFNGFLVRLKSDYIQTTFEEGFKVAAASYSKNFGNIPHSMQPGDYTDFDEAVCHEFGLSPTQMIDIGELLNSIGSDESKTFFLMKQSELIDLLSKELSIASESIREFIMAMRIYPRKSWDKDLPKGCEKKDVYPWLFKRKYSVVRRPLIEINLDPDPLIIVSPFLVKQSISYLLEYSYRGEFSPEYYESSRMREFQGKAKDRRSDSFEKKTADVLLKAGFHTKIEVNSYDLSAPSVFGDIDVLAWKNDSLQPVLAIECKALRNARSTSEILSQLDQFRGESGDLLFKHKRRLKWLEENPESFKAITKTKESQIQGIIVTSHIVPMQFMATDNDQEIEFMDIATLEKQLAEN
jgi:hypothetical protein